MKSILGALAIGAAVLAPLSVMTATVLSTPAAAAPQAETALVHGFVRADDGEILAFANVFFTDGYQGTMASSEGEFFILTRTFGDRTLRVSYIGRESIERTITIHPGDTLRVDFVIGVEPIELQEIVTTASAYTIGDLDNVSITSLDVVRTPGTAADVFRALQMFPGLVQVDEGAGLFVRGGDISETLTLLDLATVSYPYKYSSPTGGFFGMFDPFLLDGIHFSTGGFSARYGNALSAVADLTSYGTPARHVYNATVSLAALSVMGAVPLNKNWGFRFAGNRSHTGLMFELNGGIEDFEQVPQGMDGSVSLSGKWGRGSVKLFAFNSRDDIGVDFESPAYNGVYDGQGETRIGNLSFSQLVTDRMSVKGSLSATRHAQDAALGVLDLHIGDLVEKARLDGSYELHPRFRINAGAELERRTATISGKVPESENDFGTGAAFDRFATAYRSDRIGTYAELETRPLKRALVRAGLRSDRDTNTNRSTLDPRLSTVWQLNGKSGVKLAWGIYHQTPGPHHYDPYSGNPWLGSMRATHYIVGYDYDADNFRARIEGYYKDYDDLLLDDDIINLTNGGYGHAQGVDVFIKGRIGLLEARFAYTYLDAKRKEFEKTNLVSADFDITHTMNLVLIQTLPWNFEVAMAYRFATGKPYTPAPDAWNSQRLPNYSKTDISLSRTYSLFPGNFTILFVSVANVFGNKNIQDYVYSPDYSERTEVTGYFDRSVYFGVSMNWF